MRTVFRVLVLAGMGLLLASPAAMGWPNVPTALKNKTLRDPATAGCAGCHAPGSITTILAGGASQLVAGASDTYTVTATGATQNHKMGVVIATSAPNASPTPLAGSAPLTYFSDTRELIHNRDLAALPNVSAAGSASYSFTFRMPATSTPGDTFTLYAVARVGISNTADSGWDHADNVTVVTAPVAPGTLNATGATTTSVSLSWTGSGPGYRVVYKTGASAPASPTDGSFVDLGTVTATTIGSLAANTQYSFRVYSRSTSGTTVYNAGGSVTRTTPPAITSSLAQVNGTVGVAVSSYTITAPGATSFGTSGLPPGVTITGAVISGTPTGGGTFNALISASNANGSDSQTKPYVIGATSQTVSFGAAPTPSYSPGGTFAVSATASSGLAVTYSSNTPLVCEVPNPNVGTITILAASLCTIRADQAGNGSFTPAFATQNVTISPVVPAAPTPGAAVPGNGTLTLPFTAPLNNGGSPITSYSASCTPSGSGTSTVSPIVVGGLTNGTPYTCTVRAINIAGPGALSTPVIGTPRADPDGLLDPNFGTAGISPFAFAAAPGAAVVGMGVGSSGGIALVGRTNVANGDFAIARWSVTGAFDTKFGEVTANFGGTDTAYGVAWTSSGGNIVVGQTDAGGGNTSIAMVLYDNIGALDPTFGTGGKATFKFDSGLGSNDAAFAVALDSSNRIHIAGQSTLPGGVARFFVARLQANGSLDTGFGAGGVTFVPTLSNGGAATRLVFDSAGRIVATGFTTGPSYSMPMVARLTAGGTLDAGFGGTGYVMRDFGSEAQSYGLALSAADGPIIAGPVFTPSDFAWTAFGSNGSTGPIYTADVSGGRTDQARALVRQADDKIVLAGLHNNGSNFDFALVRFLSNGTVDTSFGANGRTITNIGTTDAVALGGIVPQLAGTAVVGGSSDNRFVVARYLLDAPSAFGFDPPTGPIGTITFVTSNTVAITGTTLPVYVEVTSGFYSIDCNPAGFTTARGTINPGQAICVRHQTGNNPGDTVTTTLVVGGQVATFTSTATFDATPDAFSFIDQVGVTPGSTVTSNTITVTGITGPTAISISNGSYSIGCTAPFTTAAGTVNNGQAVCVRHTASASFLTQVQTTLQIGALFGFFNSTTAAADSTPDQFTFIDVTNVAFDSVITSNAITVTGINTPATITVFSGSFSIGCNGTFGTAAAQVVNGDTVCVRHRSSLFFSGSIGTILTIGGVSDTFTSTTVALDQTPDAFSFNDVTNVPVSSVVTSNPITVSGINAGAAISVSGGTYSIGCGTTFVSTAGFAFNGQTVCVRHTAAASLLTPTDTTLTIGGVSDTFTSTTTGTDTTPDAFSFNDAIDVNPGSVVTSNTIVVSGINAPAAISVAGGAYSIGCGATFVTTAGTIANGQSVCVRHAAPLALGAATDTTLTIGGVSDTFSSMTLASLPPGGDQDSDGIPNAVETPESRNPFVKDNEIFTNHRLFAMQQYRDFLGREGDAGGIDFFVNLLDTGAAVRANVIESFFFSPEFSGTVSPIVRLYFATFLRIPDYPGLIFQVDAFRAGTPLDVIANNFTLSPEFQATYGALDNAQYVALLYQNILNRTASQGEIDFHVARLVSGVTRGAVLVGFSESPEYQQASLIDVYVTMMYVGMLRRAPEQAGFDFWVDYMEAGNPGLALILGFLNAPEYRNRFLPP